MLNNELNEERHICECDLDLCELPGELYCFECNCVFSMECFKRRHETSEEKHEESILEIVKGTVIKKMKDSVYMGPSVTNPKKEESKEGKVFRMDGSIIYEGEFDSGKMLRGKLFYETGPVKYIGDFNESGPEGIGQSFLEDGKKVYEGEFKNGIADGMGVEFYANGNKKYDGEFFEGRMHGWGKKYGEEENILYEGNFVDGEVKGRGKKYHIDETVEFEGIFPEEYEDFLYEQDLQRKQNLIFGLSSALTVGIMSVGAAAMYYRFFKKN